MHRESVVCLKASIPLLIPFIDIQPFQETTTLTAGSSSDIRI